MMLHTVSLNTPELYLSGRIGREADGSLLFCWAGSFFRFILRGRHARIRIRNERSHYQSALGIVMNGFEGRTELEDGVQELDLSPFLIDEVNDITVYKRQDGCHRFFLLSLEAEGELLPAPPHPDRRIEIFGDSVSCGEVCEAMHLTGRDDPEGHDGIYSNSWYSYGWQTARALEAEIHLTAQGGVALQPGRGWFNDPYVGMTEIWDKLNYNDNLGPRTPWQTEKYIPQLVIAALGQNDAHPGDFMAEDPHGTQAEQWKRDYIAFLGQLRSAYPRARIILTATVLMHHPAWEDALDEIAARAGRIDPRILRFRFRRAGIATPGHPRISEQTEMARELTSFIRGLGAGIWTD